jgi:hypothetical protein
MGRPKGWATMVTGRPVMRSPGRPGLGRDAERGFWRQVATGFSNEAAAAACGVSVAVGVQGPTFNASPSDQVTVTENSKVNAGDYNAKVTLKDATNYVFSPTDASSQGWSIGQFPFAIHAYYSGGNILAGPSPSDASIPGTTVNITGTTGSGTTVTNVSYELIGGEASNYNVTNAYDTCLPVNN